MKRSVSVILIFCLLLCSFAAVLPVFAFEEYCVGDANFDSALTVDDARLALRFATKITAPEEAELQRVDINLNGRVDLDDVEKILLAALKIEPLQHSGAFFGFDGDGKFETAQEALEYFNTHLNKIKTNDAGFISSKSTDIYKFDVGTIQFRSLSTTKTEVVAEVIKNSIEETYADGEPNVVALGTDNDSLVEALGADYVSVLTLDDICGIMVENDEVNDLVTVSVSLYDETEQEAALSGSYAKALAVDKMNSLNNTVTKKFFGADGAKSALKKYQDVVLRAVFNTATGNVVSYTVSYDNCVYATSANINVANLGLDTAGIGSVLGTLISVTVKNFDYAVKTTVSYRDFQWQ